MTSYMTKIATGVAALAVVAAIAAPAAVAISPNNPSYGPTGLRYSRGEPVVTSVQSTPTPSSSLPNLPPITGVPFRTTAQPAPVSVASQSTGFDWADAAVGALTTAGACVVLMGLALGIRRRDEPKAV
jgi:hypothetical protein